MYSLVWTQNLNSRLTYVLHHSLGVQQDTLGFNALNSRHADWYGVNQYLFYKINCCWTAGVHAAKTAITASSTRIGDQVGLRLFEGLGIIFRPALRRSGAGKYQVTLGW